SPNSGAPFQRTQQTTVPRCDSTRTEKSEWSLPDFATQFDCCGTTRPSAGASRPLSGMNLHCIANASRLGGARPYCTTMGSKGPPLSGAYLSLPGQTWVQFESLLFIRPGSLRILVGGVGAGAVEVGGGEAWLKPDRLGEIGDGLGRIALLQV